MVAFNKTKIAKLNKHRFSAKQVTIATLISAGQLNNTINKSDLLLCSPRSGQGRAREFCLIDIYQVGLFHVLSRLTGDAQWSASLLNLLLFEEWIDEKVERMPLIRILPPREQRERFCADIKAAPYFYRVREPHDPLVYYIDHWQIHVKTAPLYPIHFSELRLTDPDIYGGIFINWARYLDRIDDELLKQVEQR